MTKGTYSHSNRHRMHEHDNVPLLEARAEILKLKRENDELVQFLFSDDLCPMAIHMEGEGYLMTPEEGFQIMEEYKQ